MKTIIVGEEIRDEMLAAGKEALILDRSGKLIGRFLAATLDDLFAEGEFPSQEELDRRTREDRRFTPEQVMDRLRSLRRSQ